MRGSPLCVPWSRVLIRWAPILLRPLAFGSRFFYDSAVSYRTWVRLVLGVVLGLTATLPPSLLRADSSFPTLRLGSQEVGLSIGPILPWRVKQAQVTKLFGVGAVPSWSIALTDPIGHGWYEGQIRLGVELVALQTTEPVATASLGIAPKMSYSFTGLGRFRPYVEGGGGPMWTDLGGRVPEQPGWFNFVVQGGGGFAYFVTPNLAINAGGRFYHISNGGTRPTNRGLNFGMPYLGFSWFLF